MTPPWRYRLLVRLLTPALLAYTLWRTYKDGGARYFCQRLGLYTWDFGKRDERLSCESGTPTTENIASQAKRLWIHAASVGEVFTVLPLIKSVQEQNNNASLLVTTGTPTGATVLAQQGIAGVRHQYLPIDFPGACTRFLDQAAIDEAWFVETEIWPWLYACCEKQSIKITIVNGRLSEKTSSQSNGILASSYQRALQHVRVLARSDDDMKNFITLGARPENVQVAGNLKYTGTTAIESQPSALTRRYVLAASTHADEELQLARCWNNISSTLLLVIVPRHPERGPAIHKQLIEELGSPVSRRSLAEQPSDNDKIYLADTLGELQAWYKDAEATFVGGSLISRGGHNMLEPARYACPTIVGPHTHNFDDIMPMMLTRDAIAIGQDANAVALFLEQASSEGTPHRTMGERARKVAEESDNVLQRYEAFLFD